MIPKDHPAIRANYLATETDRQCMIDGLKLARQLAESEALTPLIAAELEPGSDVVTDEDFLDYARKRGGTIFHPTSTCMMGPSSNPTAVVDNELRVHGLRGLRVADASIMPTVVSGNTNAACIMIGEKLASHPDQPRHSFDLINHRQEWKKMTIGLIIHSLLAAIWVGGMFFAYVILRPSLQEIDPPVRLTLWRGVLKRFFPGSG